MSISERVSVVIPTYRGTELLRKFVPSIVAEVGSEDRLIIVDDGSGDDSADKISSEFPSARLIARQINGGFSAAVNEGIRSADGEFVVLLNNDIEVQPGLLEPILALFDDEKVFAVGPRIITPSLGGIDDGAKTGKWHHGIFWSGNQQGINEVKPVLFTSGGASVYRHSMLMELGGFDEAYSPFYWEDADLNYRAWKRGWKSLYQPASTVRHEHSSTIKKFDSGMTASVMARNSLFFVWRNVEDEGLLKQHRSWLPLVLLKRAALGDWPYLAGWQSAFARRKEAVAARNLDSKHRILSDGQIFDAVGLAVPK